MNDSISKADQFFPRTYKIAQIIALIATPIVVAIIGWVAQHSSADANANSQKLAATIGASAQISAMESGIQRDLLQTAVQILRSPRHSQDADIRDWATKVMAKYSPVPFSTAAADQLSKSVFSMLETNPFLIPAMEERPSCPAIDINAIPAAQAKEVQQLQQLCVRNAKDLFWLKVFVDLVRKSPNPSTPEIENGEK
ncbi:hypothetical protein [Advenella mimigardefordensis]|uniref:hypothetical protein n=1 Tax=Advenella mimigardefordensis TaxID=302406 RepID=UPI00046CB1B4|nr:hypothetical protein [Advenella mimigardefordensis]